METLADHHSQLVLNSLGDGKPMQALEDWRDVFVPAGAGYKASRRILYGLQSPSLMFGYTVQKAVAVIESAADEGVGERCCRCGRQRANDSTQLAKLVKATADDVRDMGGHREVLVDGEAQISNRPGADDVDGAKLECIGSDLADLLFGAQTD